MDIMTVVFLRPAHYWSHYPGVLVSASSDGSVSSSGPSCRPDIMWGVIISVSSLSFSSQFIFVAHNNKVNDVKFYSWLSFSLHEKSPTELKVHLYSDF